VHACGRYNGSRRQSRVDKVGRRQKRKNRVWLSWRTEVCTRLWRRRRDLIAYGQQGMVEARTVV
jgi:hypothetical protein